MVKDATVGVLLLSISLASLLGYGWLLFLSDWALEVLKFTIFGGVTVILVLLAWIGYTLATAPPPPSLDEIPETFDEDSEPESRQVEE